MRETEEHWERLKIQTRTEAVKNPAYCHAVPGALTAGQCQTGAYRAEAGSRRAERSI
jgi:hypothetical protein